MKTHLVFVCLFLGVLCPVGQSEETSQTLRLLTYNIWGLYPIVGGKASWRYDEIGQRLSSYDIVAMQECWDVATEVIPTKSGFPYVARGKDVHRLVGGSGLITLSRFPIIETETITYTHCGGFDCLANKGALRTRIQLPSGTVIDVYNTHLNAWLKVGKDLGAVVRRHQIEQLSEWVHERSRDKIFFILADTNSADDTANYTDMIQNWRSIDLYRYFNSSGQDYDGKSWDSKKNPWISKMLKMFQKPIRIDYLWLNDLKGIEVKNAQLEFTGTPGKDRPLSDHFGVSVELEIK